MPITITVRRPERSTVCSTRATASAQARRRRPGGDDPQPGDAERRDQREKEDGEGRPEVVEDRAADEERLWRSPRGGARGACCREDSRLLHPEIVARATDICTDEAVSALQLRSQGHPWPSPSRKPASGADQPASLQELQSDARVPDGWLGRRINLSAPAVAERVQRLERAGVITGYRRSRSEGDRLSDHRRSSESGRRRGS